MAEYIDREEYCEKHCRCSNEYCDKESCPIWKAPAADVEPVVYGRWNADETCSVCGEKSTEGLDATKWDYWLPNYCPNCGAKMDGGDSDALNLR
jgi:hypothetical protein